MSYRTRRSVGIPSAAKRADPSTAAITATRPISTSQTTLSIEVQRFYCRSPCCSRRTFAEPMSDLLGSRPSAGHPSLLCRPWPVASFARRSRRLAETQGRVGIVCGGAGGARLLKHCACRRAALRCCGLSGHAEPDEPTPVHVGVDDWAEWARAHVERSSMGWHTEGMTKG